MFSARQTISNYYSLTKPGLVYGNLISTLGGFLLAARGNISFTLLLTTLKPHSI